MKAKVGGIFAGLFLIFVITPIACVAAVILAFLDKDNTLYPEVME